MSIGIIGIALLVGVVIFAILYGYGLFFRAEERTPEGDPIARCSLCGRRFKRRKMVERAIGIEKLYYFCGECIKKLYSDYMKLED
jgi:uncharacterized C2H2 Zn-finger protein